MSKYVLVTGGLGYIGSHLVVELLNQDYQVIVMDDLSNSSLDTMYNIQKITGKEFILKVEDVTNWRSVKDIFCQYQIDTVFHLASYKAVGESVTNPLQYYDNNCRSTLNILKAMEEYRCDRLIFSSSACVYGDPQYLPIDEDHPVNPTNPYGNTKVVNEMMIKDFSRTGNYKLSILRYFNPIGSHTSGLLQESPNGKPNNLMPYITQVASGNYDYLNIYGDDYETHDGTGVRDYIHVLDLVEGHILAMKNDKDGVHIYNLGSGKGYSVLDIVHTFRAVHEVELPYRIASRRDGDVAKVYASNSLAKEELGWYPKHDLYDMCFDSWSSGGGTHE